MPYNEIADLPAGVQESYSEECQQVWLETFNATDGDEQERFSAANAAGDACEADKGDTPEPDCGCSHAETAGRRPVEHKVLPLAEAAVDDSGEGTFTGYANVFGIVDDGGDKVVKGAFKSVIPDFVKDGFIGWAHDWSQPVATIDSAVEDDHGLLITATFHGTAEAQRARQLTAERLKRGKTMGLSIGYEVDAAKETTYGRDITSFKRLFETSLVTVPMNRPSTVTAVKGSLGSGKPYAERLELVLAELKALTDHSRQRADLRLKEGRVLSGANRDRISELKKSLAAVLRDLEELLQATDPGRDKAAAQAALARAFETLAGVN